MFDIYLPAFHFVIEDIVSCFAFVLLQSGAVTILQPNLLDYERQQRFELLIEVHDLATALNERRSVRIHQYNSANRNSYILENL